MTIVVQDSKDLLTSDNTSKASVRMCEYFTVHCNVYFLLLNTILSVLSQFRPEQAS